jgi:hypothetical protein
LVFYHNATRRRKPENLDLNFSALNEGTRLPKMNFPDASVLRSIDPAPLRHRYILGGGQPLEE